MATLDLKETIYFIDSLKVSRDKKNDVNCFFINASEIFEDVGIIDMYLLLLFYPLLVLV